MRRSATLLCATLAAAALAAGAASRPTDAFVQFQLPSTNIGCGYSSGMGLSTYIRCDIRSGLRPEPRKRCELDWTGVFMAGGAAHPACAGDTVLDPRAPVLAYGTVWKRGSFSCLSSRIGLSCANRAGHGFFLSRERWVAG